MSDVNRWWRGRLPVAMAGFGLVSALAGCATVEFYVQAAAGQAALLLGHRGALRDARDVIDDPQTDPELAAKLLLIDSMLRYAEDQLALPRWAAAIAPTWSWTTCRSGW